MCLDSLYRVRDPPAYQDLRCLAKILTASFKLVAIQDEVFEALPSTFSTKI